MHVVVRVLGFSLAGLAAFALVPAAVYVADSRSYEAARYPRPALTAAAAAAVTAAVPPAHDPARPTAVIVVGNQGANIADTLVPYEALAATGRFNVYTVAPERRPVPLLGGLDLVPDLSFTQLHERLGRSAPDVTVVPDMPADPAGDARVTAWLRDTASHGLLLGVCTGARVLAQAGLLDGRDATSHWYRLIGLQGDYPAVRWHRGVRYLDDGDVITTGGLLSSVDGTLRVIERLAGTDVAASAARTVGWRYYSPGTAATLPQERLTPANAVTHLLNLGFRANATTVDVAVTDGVGEIELASAFDPYAEIKAARTVAVAAGSSIRSRHGLTFIPRAGLDAVGRADRLLVPGAAAHPVSAVAAARRAGIPVVYLHRQPGFAFDPALRDLARTLDVPTARWAGKILEYPTAGLALSGPRWPWMATVRLLLLGLAGLAAGAAIACSVRLARPGRTRRP
jgi:putative intracellular protease/amidase